MHFDRLSVVAELPPDGGWRADLALDRSASPPRPVRVARVPPAVVGDALALSRLARGVDLASRVEHPALRRLLGTGEVAGDLVLVEDWREGETLRGLLDAGGPLTPELAARLAVDLAGALHAGHTLPAALDRPLCHGAVRAERVLLAENGEVLLCGLGRPCAEDVRPADDLRSLARLILDSLPPAGGGEPGPLAAVLDRALAGEGYATAAAFAEAVAAAVTPADAAAVAARVEASQPEGKPAWLERRRALEQALATEGPSGAGDAAGAGQPDLASGLASAPPGSTPPPLPGVPTPASAPGALGAEPPVPGAEPADADAFVVLDPASPRPGGAAPAPGHALLPAAWLDHPRAPQVVAAALGLLGLLLGFALGRR